jgi:hypothetical protein
MLIDIAKQGVKSAALFFWENIKFIVPGLALTAVLGVWMLFMIGKGPGSPVARAGGIGALIAVLTSPTMMAFFILTAGFPFAYFTFGRKRGFARVIAFLTADKKDAIAQFIVERFTGFVERKKPGMLGNAVQSQQDWLDMFNQFIADKEGLPKVLRKLIKHYSQKVGIAQAIGVSASQSGGKITTQQLSDSVAGQISDKIDAMGQLPSAWWFWGIAAGQVVFFFVMKYFVT